jgi:predicted membrane protein
MKKNVGSTDKTIRLLLALGIVLLNYFEVITGTTAIVFLAIAIILVVTSFVNFCPLYAILGKSTCPTKQ